MRNIKILDCTLRDGGYVNENKFGIENIKKIIIKLEESKVDIIECGYLMDHKSSFEEDYTEYTDFEDFDNKHKKDLSKHEYTLMLLGEKYKIENLIPASNENQYIRMTFHKKGIKKAVDYAKIIQSKGYKLYFQPTVTMGYTDEEMIKLIKITNEQIKPVAIAIVDTFGQMTPNDIKRYTNLFNEYLDKNIKLAFHAHNNLQNAYANAIEFIKLTEKSNREIIIDSSIFGMGRGAGNLPTELIMDYLNREHNKNYNITPILELSDEIITKIKEENDWGYSLPYYLSAKKGVHPSYVLSFLNKQALPATDIEKLLDLISEDKKEEYSKEYANELYNTYNSKDVNEETAKATLSEMIENKKVLLIGPGQTILENQEKIEKFQNEENVFSIAINSESIIETDALFFGNKKRYNENNNTNKPTFLTSNIKEQSNQNELILDYKNAIVKEPIKSDNSLLMLINILESINCKEIIVAGFDGFKIEKHQNFYNDKLEYTVEKNYIDELNKTIKENIEKKRDKVKIKTLTPSINID